MTATTVTQVRTLLRFGIRRIIVANTLVHPPSIEWLADRVASDPDLEVMVFADSLDAVHLLDKPSTGSIAANKLGVLAELRLPDRRTGAPEVGQATAVARAVAASPRLSLSGVSAYEGVVPTDRQPATLKEVERICRASASLITGLQDENLFEGLQPTVTVG